MALHIHGAQRELRPALRQQAVNSEHPLYSLTECTDLRFGSDWCSFQRLTFKNRAAMAFKECRLV